MPTTKSRPAPARKTSRTLAAAARTPGKRATSGATAAGKVAAGKAAAKNGEGKKVAGKKAAGKTPAPRRTPVAPASTASASKHIDARIASLGDWRGEVLAQVRAVVHEALPGVIEEWKWENPVWSQDGILFTGESYKKAVKLTFPKGATLADPAGLFNSSLEGKVRRAIDFPEGSQIDRKALKALFRAAAALNAEGRKPAAPAQGTRKAAAKPAAAKTGAGPKLLAGGNPQIAKADGDDPVQAYIAAIPVDWQREFARRLDALIVRVVPKANKAVRWNSPFYGIAGQGWFVSFHVFTRYVKLTFFKGTELKPVPSGGTGQDGRWIDVHEGDFDEAQAVDWIRQAAAMPGWGKN